MRFSNNKTKWQKSNWNSFIKNLSLSKFYSNKLPYSKLDLSIFPIINKKIFMENFDTINTVKITKEEAFSIALKAEHTRDFSPEINNITIGLSSGTSGNRGIFMASENEKAKWVAVILDRVIGFTFKRRNIAFFLRANSNLYEATKSRLINFQFFDILLPTKNHLERLNKLNPQIIIGQPSLLLELAELKLTNELQINPSKIISVAEVLEEKDKEFLENTFNQIIHQVYQCTEGLLASTCKNGTLHFHEDYLIIEKKYYDDNKRFHPIISDLARKSQPIIRYELNDIIIQKNKCDCGNPFLAIEKIEGRSDDQLTFVNKDGNIVSIFPDFFRRCIIMADTSITDYMILQTQFNQLEVYTCPLINDTKNKVENEIIELLSKYDITNVKLNFLDKKPFTRGEKLRRIKNGIKTY